MTLTPSQASPLQESLANAIQSHRNVRSALFSAKVSAFEAGCWLNKARAICPKGEWEETLAAMSDVISRRTAFLYIRFFTECKAWAEAQNPRLLDERKLELAARDLVLESALTFMDLCRDLGVIAQRPANGARDGKGAREPRQTDFVFNFDSFDFGLMAVERSEGNPFLTVPREELQLSRHRAAMALELIDEALKTEAVNALVGVSTEVLLPGERATTETTVAEIV